MANAIIYSSNPDFARGVALALKSLGTKKTTLTSSGVELDNALRQAKAGETLFVLLSAKELTLAGFEGLMVTQSCLSLMAESGVAALLLEPEHLSEEAQLTGLLGINRVVHVPESLEALQAALRETFADKLGPPTGGASTRSVRGIRPVRAKPDGSVRALRSQPHHKGGSSERPDSPPPPPATRKGRKQRAVRPKRQGPITRRVNRRKSREVEAAKAKANEPLPTAAPRYSPEVFFEKGLVSMGKGMFAHAYQAFTAAAAGAPDNIEYLAHKVWAMVLTDDKQRTQGEEILAGLEALGASKAIWAHLIRARLAAEGGDSARAAECYAAVLEIDPGHPEAHAFEDDFGKQEDPKHGLLSKLFGKS